MFVQVIRGPVGTRREVQEMLQRWLDHVRPGAIGWLGSTAGVTPTGELLLLARFSSAEDARRNADRPEQTAWWEEMAKRFTGAVTFHDCDEVGLILAGGHDDAGFVQVMQWSSVGSHTAAQLAALAGQLVHEHRPDVLGGFVAVARDGTTFQPVFFTSEEDARRAEATGPPPEALEQMAAVIEDLGEPIYHDLPDPWLSS